MNRVMLAFQRGYAVERLENGVWVTDNNPNFDSGHWRVKNDLPTYYVVLTPSPIVFHTFDEALECFNKYPSAKIIKTKEMRSK